MLNYQALNFLSHRATNCAQVSISGFGAVSCFIRQALAREAFERDLLTLHVIDAKPSARILSEIELRQISVEMTLIDVLIHAD